MNPARTSEVKVLGAASTLNPTSSWYRAQV